MRLLLFLSLSGLFVLLFFRGIGCVKKHRIVRHIPTRPKTVKANYVLITAAEGFKTNAQVRVSYSRKKDATHNEVVTEERTTPFWVGGYEVVVLYDSLEIRNTTSASKKETIEFQTNLLRNYEPGGSDYFEIKHLSGDPIEYAIATEGHWQFFTKADKYFQKNPPPNPYRLADGEDWLGRFGAAIHGFTPIHYETNYPIIYLLCPELAPVEPMYVGATNSSDVFYVKLCRSEVPKMSLEDIMQAYRKSAKGLPGLRERYAHPLSQEKSNFLRMNLEQPCGNKGLYGKIEVGKSLRNESCCLYSREFGGGGWTVSLDRAPSDFSESLMLILGNGFSSSERKSIWGKDGTTYYYIGVRKK